MRVCVVSSYPPEKNGIASYTEKIVEGLRKRHCDWVFRVLAIDVKGLPREHNTGNLTVERVWHRAKRLYFLGLIKALREFTPDVVHVQHAFALFGEHLGFNLVPFLLYCRLRKIPVVTTIHEVWVLERFGEKIEANRLALSVAKWMFYSLTRALVNFSDVTVVLNRATLERLVKEYRVEAEKVRYIHSAALVPVRRIDKHVAKRKLGLQDRFVLLCFGMPYKTKGYEYAIKALPRVVESNPDTVLIITNAVPQKETREYISRDYVERLRRLAKELNVEKNVVFTGYIEPKDVPYYLSAADAGLLPYLSMSGISSVLYNQLAYGTPCIVSNIERFSEIRDGVNGLVVPVGDSAALADAVLRLARDRELRDRIVRNIRKTVRDEWNWDYISKKTEALYKDVVAKSASA